MKTKHVLSAFFLLTSLQIFAQRPLVVVWNDLFQNVGPVAIK